MATGGDNVQSIRAKIDNPIVAPDLRDTRRRGRAGGGDDGDDRVVVLPGAPITPLGIQGMKLWLLDAANQLQLVSTDCRKGDLQLLFGGDAYLISTFPQLTKEQGKMVAEGKARVQDIASTFDQADVQSALIKACWAKGPFNPQGRVFGRGAHRASDDDGKLVLHMGRRVLIAGARDKKGDPSSALVEHPAGAIEGSFYPALQALPPPAAEPSTDDEGRELMALFGDWKWVEPDAAPLLLFGMCAQMFICGALTWRSHVWLAGPTSAGKTTLQRVMRAVHAGWCLETEDASEAGVRNVLHDDTLPVMIDEAEADDNPERQRAMMNLAKKSSSGGKMYRGSPEGKAQEFVARTCFLFSSVMHSLSKGEERNRFALLEMRDLPPPQRDKDGNVIPWVEPDMTKWRDIGRRMHRRMIEQWPRFNTTLADYKREIASHGVEGRWQDTFGTLLACADCLIYRDAPRHEHFLNDDHGREKKWVLRVLPLILKTRSEARSDVERCIAHLMAQLLPGAHGAPAETVGQWIMRAMAPNVPANPLDDDDGGINEVARNRLKSHGLRLVTLKAKGGIEGEPLPNQWDTAYLAVAYPTNAPLGTLFKGTEWAAGGYLQSLGKIEGVVKNGAGGKGGLKVRFGGMKPDNAIAVPLAALKGEEA